MTLAIWWWHPCGCYHLTAGILHLVLQADSRIKRIQKRKRMTKCLLITQDRTHKTARLHVGLRSLCVAPDCGFQRKLLNVIWEPLKSELRAITGNNYVSIQFSSLDITSRPVCFFDLAEKIIDCRIKAHGASSSCAFCDWTSARWRVWRHCHEVNWPASVAWCYSSWWIRSFEDSADERQEGNDACWCNATSLERDRGLFVYMLMAFSQLLMGIRVMRGLTQRSDRCWRSSLMWTSKLSGTVLIDCRRTSRLELVLPTGCRH